MDLRFIQAQGPPCTRGRLIGETARQRILQVLAAQECADQGKDGKTLHEWGPAAQRFLPYIREYAPTTLAEMEGMAEGAGLPFDDILLLACAYEKHMGGDVAEHCTGFAAMGTATANGDLICGQNNDEAIDPWLGGSTDVVIHHIDPSGLETLLYTHPGIPAYMGMNSAGLCLLWMYIDNGERRPGVPTCVLLRELLCHTSLDAALTYLGVVPRAVPNNFLLAHATSGICNVEYSVTRFHPVWSETALCHANHILDPQMSPEDVTRHSSNTSRSRHACLAESVEAHTGRIDVAAAQRMLSSHQHAPQCVCAHPHEGAPLGQTLASMIFHPAAGEMFIAFGNGCTNPYHRYTFTAALR